jgi:hypothetical protein
MLDPDKIRATGESVSILWCEEGSSGGLGELRRSSGDGLRALLAFWFLSGEGSFERGVGGNLKLSEKELEAFLVPVPIAGVLGAVEAPGDRRAGRAGRLNPAKGSCMIGAEDPPPAKGEWCVADR